MNYEIRNMHENMEKGESGTTSDVIFLPFCGYPENDSKGSKYFCYVFSLWEWTPFGALVAGI